MTLPKYRAYRESGVKWLGEVPADWEVTQLKRVVDAARPITYGIVQAGPHVPDGVPYIRPVDMTEERGVDAEEALLRTSPDIAEAYSRSKLRTGDLVCSIGPSFGKVMVAPPSLDGANLTQGTARVAVAPDFCARYFFWSLRSCASVAQWESSIGGATFRALNLGPLSATLVALPSLTEQSRIASFLDRETAKLDELIAEQQRLVDVLREKREAAAVNAVSRGLDPAIAVRPSGNDWLKLVPAHWAVERIKWVARMESGHTPDKKVEAYWENCDIPWVSLNDTAYLKDNDYISDTASNINELGIANSSARLLPPRAVVFSRDATIGRCAITTRPMAVSQHFIAWICGESLLPEFLLLRLRTMTQELEQLTTGATVRTIGMPDVKTLVTPLPPLEEQRAIVEHVASSNAKLGALMEEAGRAIALLQERRAALISAAVTGKIDVRGLVSADAEAA